MGLHKSNRLALEFSNYAAVDSSANGVEKGGSVIQSATISPWSSGQDEGQITKFELIQRKCMIVPR